MFTKKIKEQLHKILFPSYAEEIENLEEDNDFLFSALHDEREKEQPKPNMSDLMKASLKLITVDFVHQEEGIPKHFLNLPDTDTGKAKRAMYISQLAQIQQLEVWDVLMENLINTQGNYTIRLGLTDMDVFAGRMQISGISLVKDEVKNGFDEYNEGRKPKEEFDATDNSTEGIPYTSDQKDEL